MSQMSWQAGAQTTLPPLLFQLNEKICRSLNINADPNPDVAYQPGRDAEDKPVAPADLSSSLSIEVPKKISIPVHLRGKNFSAPLEAPYGLSLEQGDLGHIDIDVTTGKIYYNGQPLFNHQEQEIRERCSSIELLGPRLLISMTCLHNGPEFPGLKACPAHQQTIHMGNG